jgi:pimeloyl-ACP methyl ester carboxylesterase
VAWAQRAMARRPDSTADLAWVDVPTLVIVGEEDTLTPLAEAEAMAAAVPAARLVRIPGAGHLSAVEAPAEFNAAVRSFLAGLPMG